MNTIKTMLATRNGMLLALLLLAECSSTLLAQSNEPLASVENVATSPSTPTTDTQEEIKALEAEWIQSYLSQAVDRFASLLHEDFVYSSERGVFRKDQYVKNLASGEINMKEFKNNKLQVIDLGDMAISYGVSKLDATFKGQDISGLDRFTKVWKKMDDGWKAVALHANKMKQQ